MSGSAMFNTDRRIRLGIWGLGRGMSFFETCRAVHIDVVAGCDLNEDLCRNFSAHNPGAFVTADPAAFLAQDFDAVLLATYAIGHADHAIMCLRAGKHVLSEVMAFFTLEEGVRLVEAVEETGLVYQLAENYPFSPVNRYLARKWQEGLFGRLMYAEFGYVHEIRSLCYTYLDGKPVQPGNTVHNWRSWMNFHYYCTHSLGPVMVITGARPTRVTALASSNPLPGYLKGREGGMGSIATSLIAMSDGGVLRNLMGSTTDDGCTQRLMGTTGAAEINNGLWFRFGGGGDGPKTLVKPDISELDRIALGSGHGGGDFWVLYYFAREILTGEKGPFDIYSAADVTLPGILACRSSFEDGAPQHVPDFRQQHERDRYRNDTWQQERYDIRAVFPVDADLAITGDFTDVMNHLCHYAEWVRSFLDWNAVAAQIVDVHFLQDEVAEPLLSDFDNIHTQYVRARRLADAYPGSDGARVINELLEMGNEQGVCDGSLRAVLEDTTRALRRQRGVAHTYLTPYTISPLLAKTGLFDETPYPGDSISFSPPVFPLRTCLDLRDYHGQQDGVMYVRTIFRATQDGRGQLLLICANAFKLWVNGEFIAGAGTPHKDGYTVAWRAGENTITIALDTANGILRARISNLWCTLRLQAIEDVPLPTA